MNWGWKIFFVTAGFILFVLFMVFKAIQQDFHLVSKDYYDKEIKYQGEIDRIRNANALEEGLKIEYMIREGKVLLTYPQDHKKSIEGDIHFFRPSDASLDISFPIKTEPDGTQSIKVAGMKKGLWQVKVNWSYGNKEYQQEKNIVIQ